VARYNREGLEALPDRRHDNRQSWPQKNGRGFCRPSSTAKASRLKAACGRGSSCNAR